ncbi:Amino acid ABC transporter permease [Rhodovastum atsumiense]|uniref:Amino acid ABC transporter permease n=1 Tax=Rhodovastum atsumiense TaxID=504468 RepID=A0A5M6IXY0_9PROT|nr:amino acid ABC transporter permease [Rhodovastum atsumiense]KAA5612215.1 amino acid ABC transporter permease [Rhodovastum atsumiense]CAH2603883.1 Amino acid ABC transporter permease [Rhodovastum atsumiense]
MDLVLDQFLNWEIMQQALPLLLRGLLVTGEISLVVVTLGLLGGPLVALASLSPRPWLRRPIGLYVDIFRALPPLVLLIFVYSGLPFAGIRLDPFAAVVVAFFLNNSAYYGEIYRAGIQSVPKGQWEAARATGLGQTQTLLYVVLPQAVRNVLPDLLSNTVEVVKATSLASVVSLHELAYSANMVRSVTYNASSLVLAALIYLAILWPMVRLVSRFQRRLAI